LLKYLKKAFIHKEWADENNLNQTASELEEKIILLSKEIISQIKQF